MSADQVAAENLRKGMRFITPDGLHAAVDVVDTDREHGEVIVEYRSPAVTGTEVYRFGTQVPLL